MSFKNHIIFAIAHDRQTKVLQLINCHPDITWSSHELEQLEWPIHKPGIYKGTIEWDSAEELIIAEDVKLINTWMPETEQ